MDTDTIVKLIKRVPRSKWDDQKTIKKWIILASKIFGKKIHNKDRLNDYVKEVQKVAKGRTSEILFSKIMELGYTKEQINEVRRKLDLI